MSKTFDQNSLFQEILRARTRVYKIGNPTPLQAMQIEGIDAEILIKREDLTPINAYKWRGAYNAMAVLKDEGVKKVVAASAGNHAQGVALAARHLGMEAKIFMPLAAPMMKQAMVKKHGGNAVDIILTGDTYNEAGVAAKEYAEKHKQAYVHPFDNIYTMAGQATIADEVVLSGQPAPDYAFVQIGGGGMAAGVSSWLKTNYPHIKVIGVEGEGQASMKASIEAGQPVTLDRVDTFCDGTAVTRPGDMTFAVCNETLDGIITVSNEEVCAAIQRYWEAMRVIPEPSGAMGLSGLVKYAEANMKEIKGKRLLSILCGANMDFGKLTLIASRASIGAHRRRYMRFHINEEKGGLLDLLNSQFDGLNVSEFLYGKTDETEAFPVIALEADPETMEKLDKRLQKAGIDFSDVTQDADTRYRIINYNAALFKHPLMLHVQFPERKGALRDFLRTVSKTANVCYFNYAYSGEAIGRALMGFEFDSEGKQAEFLKSIENTPVTVRPVEADAAERILRA